MTDVLIKRDIWRQIHTEKLPREDKRVMFLEAKKYQRWPTNYQKLGERPGTDSLSQPSEGTNPANTLISDF